MKAAQPNPGRLPIALALIALLSAMGLIHTTHQCRIHYADLQRLEVRRWALQEDYSRLLLEHSTWAAPHRVYRLAHEDLRMVVPDLGQYRVVDP